MAGLMSIQRTGGASKDTDKSKELAQRQPDDVHGSNSSYIMAIDKRLRSRSDEIRNTDIVSDNTISSDDAETEERQTIKRQQTAAKAKNKRLQLESELFGDKEETSFVRSLDKTTINEADRTKLVGMTETAESSARRVEALERQQSTAERVLINDIGEHSSNDDYFSFLRRRREDDDNENSTQEDKE